MTEDQIECTVENRVDEIDWRFMNTAMSQADYDAAMRRIHDWAENQYRKPAILRTSCPMPD